MSIGTRTFSCSAVELTYLASVLGAEALAGVPDPFTGWLAEEIDEAWAMARLNLAECGVIRFDPGGQAIIDEAVRPLISACAAPAGSVMLSYTPAGGAATVHYVHAQDGLIVEQQATLETITLTPLHGPSHLRGRMKELLHLDSPPVLDAAEVSLPAAEFARARPEQSQHLADTLSRPVGNGCVVALIPRQDGWLAEGIGLLEGENGLWLLRSFQKGGQEWIRATPATIGQAMEAISRLAGGALGVELSPQPVW